MEGLDPPKDDSDRKGIALNFSSLRYAADTGYNPLWTVLLQVAKTQKSPKFGSQIKSVCPPKFPNSSTLSPSPPFYPFPPTPLSPLPLSSFFSDHDPPQFEDPEMKEASFVGTLVSPISPIISLICILVPFFLLRKSCGADDPHFLRCSVPKNCGDGQNITFPFFIQGSQHENYFCGQTGFPVSCKINGQPTIFIAGINYTIHQIFYQNQTIRVSNPDFSNSSTDCFSLTKNISLPGVRFELVPNQSNLVLLYNCSNNPSSLPSDLHFYTGCLGEKILALSQGYPKLADVSNECKTRVVAPVQAAYGVENHDEIRGALGKGFWLKWKANDCSRCEHSGGFCGTKFDNSSNYRFQCFCTDRPHNGGCQMTRIPEVLKRQGVKSL